MTGPREGERDRLLEAMLGHVPLDGWSEAALEAAARELGVDAGTAALAFPGGARQALARFSRRADRAMVSGVPPEILESLRMHERIGRLVLARLDALAPHREAVRRGTSFLARPGNAALGARLLYRTVDDIWHAAGDRSADFSFYTKRGILAGVLASTTLFWLGDASGNRAATREFLDRRLAEVMRFHGARARAAGVRSALSGPLNVLREAVSDRYGCRWDRRVT